MSDFNERADTLRNSFSEQIDGLAELYGEILIGMNDPVKKARHLAETYPDSVRGIKELKQLLQIMDGNFSKIAGEIIEESRARQASDSEAE